MSLYSPFNPLTSPHLSGFDRIRTEEGSTGFYEGRQFRLFYDFQLAASSQVFIKVVTPGDLLLMDRTVRLDYGFLNLEVIVGGTESGTFDQFITPRQMNVMASSRNRRQFGTAFPAEALSTLATGGSLTGGTVVDRLRLNTAVEAQAQSAGSEKFIPRGLAPGTYYIRLQNLQAQETSGIVYYTWEELSADPNIPDSQYLR